MRAGAQSKELISRGSAYVTFSYDADNQRLWQSRSSGGGTLYLNGGAAPAELQTAAGGSYQWNNYIVAGEAAR